MNNKAANAANLLVPFLRVKKRQAEIILELRKTHDNDKYKLLSYWYKIENPGWENTKMLSFYEASLILNMDIASVRQAVANKTIPSINTQKYAHNVPRIPENFLNIYKEHKRKSKDGRGRTRPLQLITWREKLWEECRQLNKIGEGKHPIYQKEGPYKPLEFTKRVMRIYL